MKKYGLIGYPLSHSFSVSYFTKKFEKEHINAIYNNYPLKDIKELRDLIQKENLDGLNVTIPYKEKVIPLLDELDATAKSIGAVNCIKIKRGKLIGYNTDITGFEKSLLDFIPIRCKALVFGTGGASKAISFVLNKNGFEVQIISRNETLNSLTYSDLNESIIVSHQLIINTTPVGTYPNIDDRLLIPYKYINKNHYVYDLIYNPEKTAFLSFCEAEGAHIKNGYEMLEIQAEESYKIFCS